jgi:hypothetical protein
MEIRSVLHRSPATESGRHLGENNRGGLLIMNADDWGRDYETTVRTLDCVQCGSVSSVSAMVFMKDSERAAAIAREGGIDAGLHLNLTTPFSEPGISERLIEHQQRISRYLTRHRLAQVVFHPGLVESFEYAVRAQHEEFSRLYGTEPKRIDGHHHMHLCANVLLSGLLPPRTLVRRSFYFQAGEKPILNRAYRKIVDRILAREHYLTDLFFSLAPLAPTSRMERLISLAHQFVVEIAAHPVNPIEHRLLTDGGIQRSAGKCPIARHSALPPNYIKNHTVVTTN